MVLILLDPIYTTAYINLNYQVVLIYIVSALTLLYCLASIVMYAIMNRRAADSPMTNCAISVSLQILFFHILAKFFVLLLQEEAFLPILYSRFLGFSNIQ